MLGGVLAATVVVAPAEAAEKPFAATVTPAGAVSVTWHGAPDRCGAAGTCGLKGGLTYRPAFKSQFEFSQNTFGSSGGFDSQTSAIVRVDRSGGGSDPLGTCVDVVGARFGSLNVSRLRAKRIRLAIGASEFGGGGLSAGRCAGPLAADLQDKLPTTDLAIAALRGKTTVVDLSGKHPFTAGSFDGEVVSTIKLTVRARKPSRARTAPRVRNRSSRALRLRVLRRFKQVKVEQLSILYAIESIDGALTTTFEGGASSPECEVLDACGLAGEITLAPAAIGGGLSVGATLRGKPSGTGTKPAAALKELRRGRLSPTVNGDFGSGKARLGAVVRRLGEPACTDSTDAASPYLAISRRRTRVLVRLLNAYSPFGANDPFRTRCMGPGTDTGLTPAVFAQGQLAVTDLGKATLTLRLTASGTFASGGFSGTRSGGLNLVLKRERMRVFRRTEFRPR